MVTRLRQIAHWWGKEKKRDSFWQLDDFIAKVVKENIKIFSHFIYVFTSMIKIDSTGQAVEIVWPFYFSSGTVAKRARVNFINEQ